MAPFPKNLAIASEAEVAAAATAMFPRGNAVDAVVAGVFAAAARHATVLLGPVQILVGGAGLGLRAVDGRVRQPGRDAPRPRGFLPQDEVPPAAYVGVPVLPGALAALLASGGVRTMNQVLAPALEIAKAASEGRRRILKGLVQRGPAILTDDGVADELVAAAGRVAGGLLTREDLDEARPEVVPCREKTQGVTVRLPAGALRAVVRVPWADERPETSPDTGSVEVLLAADARGLVAVACYQVGGTAVTIDALGLSAPAMAAPVLRGTPRVRPGTPRPARAPVALLTRVDDVVEGAVALVGASAGEEALEVLLQGFRTKAPDEALAAARPPESEGDGLRSDAGQAFTLLRAERGPVSLPDPRR